ncbi:hypothetical protein Nepgr_006025 [Nepenthes gracilis]|uniref:Glutaredoxin domain-containing protein n=1 Tax=Nepenthes gracilis TaxID=150966 RepID=A0AAD3XH69_NEPGR|nr:hypothetical protein Nepgr_006025 [Nepenthes gracilis]
MWVPWLKSPTRIRTNNPESPNSDFRCSSFKDVHILFEDDPPKLPHSPVHKSSLLNRVRISASIIRVWAAAYHRPPPNAHNRIVVYYTSLRIVRRTFEDCRAVRSILKGFRVKMDERDLSMDSAFLEELQKITGSKKNLTLPRVFIDGKYVGGADEIRRLHEIGELKRMIEGLALAEPGVCGVCGGHRFVLCEWCNGSHKVYIEKTGFKSCSDCNLNGLNRCSACTSVVF